MINWPKYKTCDGPMGVVWNAAIDACKKAFEERIAMHQDTTDWNEGGRLAQEYLNRHNGKEMTVGDLGLTQRIKLIVFGCSDVSGAIDYEMFENEISALKVKVPVVLEPKKFEEEGIRIARTMPMGEKRYNESEMCGFSWAELRYILCKTACSFSVPAGKV